MICILSVMSFTHTSFACQKNVLLGRYNKNCLQDGVYARDFNKLHERGLTLHIQHVVVLFACDSVLDSVQVSNLIA